MEKQILTIGNDSVSFTRLEIGIEESCGRKMVRLVMRGEVSYSDMLFTPTTARTVAKTIVDYADRISDAPDKKIIDVKWRELEDALSAKGNKCIGPVSDSFCPIHAGAIDRCRKYQIRKIAEADKTNAAEQQCGLEKRQPPWREFGQAIRMLRKGAGLTMKDVADKANVPVATISALELGKGE